MTKLEELMERFWEKWFYDLAYTEFGESLELESVKGFKPAVLQDLKELCEEATGGEGIRSMEEFQQKYFPDSVGKQCPYCRRKTEQARKEEGEWK